LPRSISTITFINNAKEYNYMRSFQIDVWRLLGYLNGKGLLITDHKVIKEALSGFDKAQDHGAKLLLMMENTELMEDTELSDKEKKRLLATVSDEYLHMEYYLQGFSYSDTESEMRRHYLIRNELQRRKELE
jgi:hypothetical protein